MQKIDRLLTGLILGIIVPMISFYIIYKYRIDRLGLLEFLDQVIRYQMLSKVLSVAVLPNLGLFFIFIWWNKLKAARGVLLATILLASTVMIIYFLN